MEKSEFLKLKPMLLHEIDKSFDSKDYIFEIKFDGIRTLIYIDNGSIIIKSRNNIILNDIFPELLDLYTISKDTCVFDGEIVLLDNGKLSFSKLQERIRLKNKNKINVMKNNNPVTFVAFDILYKNKDLTNKSLIERKNILNLFKDRDNFIKSTYIEERGKDLFNAIKIEDLEGIIAKKKDSLYTYGKRVKEWIKIKNFKSGNFYICGYKENKRDNTISIILGEKKKNSYNFVGKVVMSHYHKYFDSIKNENIIKNYLDIDEKINYIYPKYKIKVCYLERTKNNLLRQPFIKKQTINK